MRKRPAGALAILRGPLHVVLDGYELTPAGSARATGASSRSVARGPTGAVHLETAALYTT